MVNDVKSIRKNFYFTEENSKKLDLIVDYLQEKSHLGEGRNVSQSIMILIEFFYYFMIETADPSLNYHQRFTQLSDRHQSMIDEVKKENRQLKRQLDQLTYLALANFHAANNPNWQAEELESVESSYDFEQKQLLDRIAELIKEDKDRGQTQKHSHKSN